VALALTVSLTCSCDGADLPTLTRSWSSSAWPTGRLPTLQVA
jgi:hypothetical protein